MIKKINEFLASPEIMGLAESTQDSYRYALVSNFLPFVRDKLAGGIQRQEDYKPWILELFVKCLKDESKDSWKPRLDGKTISGSTIQQYLTIIKLFLKWNCTPIRYT